MTGVGDACPYGDDGAHWFSLNAAGEHECSCGANMGVMGWRTDELFEKCFCVPVVRRVTSVAPRDCVTCGGVLFAAFAESSGEA